MKKFSKLKIIQMIVFIVVAIVGIVIVFTDAELYQMIGFDPHIRILSIVLWVALGLAFVFMFLDYRLDSQLRRENEELNYAFYTDPDTGIANRNSCDAYINQFDNRLLPEGMAAFTIMVSNLKELNEELGYEQGDKAISDLAGILQGILPKGDFLGRNGGDRFLIIMRKCSKTDKEAFLRKIDAAIAQRNKKVSEEEKIEHRVGAALQVERHAMTLHTLVAVSDRKAHGENLQ
ncbi:MAG: GGDEF domain-containing protein [Clostridiales bacterium]|nr:GGDEF domain-containing protein [Clostridiales bacterium]